MSKTIQGLDRETHNYLTNIDPVIQVWRSICHTGGCLLPDTVALLEKIAPINQAAMQAYNVVKANNFRDVYIDVIPHLDKHHKQIYQPFWDHYHNYQYLSNYILYYYNSMVCNDKILLNEAMRMSGGVSAGDSSIWVVDKAKILPTLIAKGCIDKIVDDAIWIGIESIACAIVGGGEIGAAICGINATTSTCIQGAGMAAIDSYKDYSNIDKNDGYNGISSYKCYSSAEYCTDSGVCFTDATICGHFLDHYRDNDSNSDRGGKDCVIS